MTHFLAQFGWVRAQVFRDSVTVFNTVTGVDGAAQCPVMVAGHSFSVAIEAQTELLWAGLGSVLAWFLTCPPEVPSA